jgi:hypothetical protein
MKGNGIYYDITDEGWSIIEITKEGWNVIEQDPHVCLFRRYKHQLPQDRPDRDWTQTEIKRLWDFFNVQECDRLLFLVTIATMFVPDIPHPILVLHGEPGTGKSTATRFIRQLVDPSQITSMALPPNAKETHQFLDHNWLAPFDNVSSISPWFSDLLCRTVTGEGTSQRSLYTDDEDFIRSYRRCVIINGIGNPAGRADLLDRAIDIEFERISCLRDEKTLFDEWKSYKPKILGCIMDALCFGLERIQSISDEGLPRMADFAKWGKAIAPVFGYEPEHFMQAYNEAIGQKWADTVEYDPFSQEVIKLVEDGNGCWKGTATDLCEKLSPKCKGEGTKPRWATSPKGVSAHLKRISPALRQSGIEVERYKESNKRMIKICKRENNDESVTDYDDLPF